ncbi:MAG: hypothetical protein AAGA68_26750 [Pseudomonadota bacterium]
MQQSSADHPLRWAALAALVASAAFSTPAGAEHTAQANFLLHCAGCHRIDGRGFEPEVPDLTRELADMLRVPGGREYLVQVPGASQAPVSDAELTALINLVVERFAPQAVARGEAVLTLEEVVRHRARKPLDIFAERARLLALIEQLGQADALTLEQEDTE